MSVESRFDFDWTDQYLLGFHQMDETHREFVERVSALLTVPEAGMAAALDAFIEHAERHFTQEHEWMSGGDFPARECHIEEHTKVMNSVRQVRGLVAQGNFAYVRELATELAKWFPGHADHMDSALAQWMVRKKFGGAPVVLKRRDVASSFDARQPMRAREN
jgi:hemerythrin